MVTTMRTKLGWLRTEGRQRRKTSPFRAVFYAPGTHGLNRNMVQDIQFLDKRRQKTKKGKRQKKAKDKWEPMEVREMHVSRTSST